MHNFDEMVIKKFETLLVNSFEAGTMAKQFAATYANDIVAHVEKAVAGIEAIDDLLSDIEIQPLNTAIDSLNSKLLVNNQKIKIENKPININMNLNVQFDALKFTTSVFTVASNAMKLDANSSLTNTQRVANEAVTNYWHGR